MTTNPPTSAPTPPSASTGPPTTVPADPPGSGPAGRPPSAGPASEVTRPGPARRALRALAVVSCVPYVSLKIAWVSGSRVGIPEGSALLDDPDLMAAANLVTVLMDAAVVVLALLFTQRWGRAVRAWLLAFPMWGATGLLAPIMVAYPAQMAAGHTASTEPFLDEWVFTVVYSGFIVQGLTLGTLFALYARDRWGGVWRGRVRDVSPALFRPVVRVVAVAASVLLLVPAALHVLWLSGSTRGLSAGRIAERGSDFFVLEGVRLLFAAAAIVGVLTMVFRLGRRLPLKAPLALAWVGTAGVGCWGGWLLLAALVPQSDPANEPTAAMLLAYAGEMITGMLLGACVAVLLRRRAERPA
ncbi:FAM174 family membrane protein [Streptomyces lavendofoliae]|uniref:LigA protein n=1 Tax=Streptomyces lavendofoliae TaxID=67314 RepID=A0A918M2F6_9ACTN|nr:FAM174 family membrane protein [Streptomyces lavendofoliae]GGU21464.1 hypothetical protein GCM10010274_05050 [Streptomyces lavendofoliae]